MKNLYLLLFACCITSLITAQGRYGDRDDARIISREVHRNVHRSVIRHVNREINRNIQSGLGGDFSREMRANNRHWRDERSLGLTRVYRYDGGSINQQMRHNVRDEIRRNIREMRNTIRHSVRAYRRGRHE